jgi:hypothetical protein
MNCVIIAVVWCFRSIFHSRYIVCFLNPSRENWWMSQSDHAPTILQVKLSDDTIKYSITWRSCENDKRAEMLFLSTNSPNRNTEWFQSNFSHGSGRFSLEPKSWLDWESHLKPSIQFSQNYSLCIETTHDNPKLKIIVMFETFLNTIVLAGRNILFEVP